MQPYEYTSLGNGHETRVLALHPGDASANLRCDLLDTRIGHTEYEAVSYAWGEPNLSRILLCGADNTYVQITPNVEALLRALRSSSRMRYLWVDMVCINQQDSQDKTQQVQHMSRIYRHATQVVVWLGEEDDGGREVIAFLHDVFRGMKCMCEPTVEPHMLDHIKRATVKNFGTDDMECVRMFFQRPWFKRRWVIQEVALAAKAIIVCGSSSINFSHFMEASMVLDSDFGGQDWENFGRRDWETFSDLPFLIDHSTMDILQSLRWMVTLSWQDKYSKILGARSYCLPILLLMERFHGAQCKEDEDRIYALLGVANDLVGWRSGEENKKAKRSQFQIPINYGRGATDAYMHFALSALRFMDRTCHGPFNLLHCAGAFRPPNLREHCLPSWVPDWRKPRLYESLLDTGFHSRGNGHAPPQKPHISEDQRFLEVEGCVFSKVSIKSDAAPQNPPTQQLVELIRKWWDLCVPTIMQRYPTASKTQYVNYFANALSAGRQLGSNFSGTFDEHRQNKVFIDLMTVILEGVCRDGERPCPYARPARKKSDESTGHTKPLDILRLSKYYLRFLNRITGGRSVFITENNQFGMCPGGAQAGDIVAVFAGASTPFLPRSTILAGDTHSNSTGSFHLVGDCYVDGIMNRESVEEWDGNKCIFVLS